MLAVADTGRLQELMERPPAASAPQQGRSWADIRRDFDILDQSVQLKPLVYFDSAATSQKPKEVVAKMTDYYRRSVASGCTQIGQGLACLAACVQANQPGCAG